MAALPGIHASPDLALGVVDRDAPLRAFHEHAEGRDTEDHDEQHQDEGGIHLA